MKAFSLLILFITTLSSIRAYGAMECRGPVQIPELNYSADAVLSFEIQGSSGRVSLYSPLTEDIEPALSFKIVAAHEFQGVVHVIAIDTHSAGMAMLFEIKRSAEKVQLVNFRGYEGYIHYGPATLDCTERVL